jgi:hypothetical protein
MTNREALCALLLAILLVSSGFVWLFGPYGLIGGGVAVALTTLLTDKREDDDG